MENAHIVDLQEETLEIIRKYILMIVNGYTIRMEHGPTTKWMHFAPVSST